MDLSGLHQQIKGLPSVSQALQAVRGEKWTQGCGTAELTGRIRAEIQRARERILARPGETPCPTLSDILVSVRQQIEKERIPHLRPVINATGILLHTGLGRAVMPEAAREAVLRDMGCCNLEMDLGEGVRNQREHVVRDLVRRLTGAEDVLVVNNNAAATLLTLQALTAGSEVVVSRGELVEIGGSFRLPEIMALGGSILREVGSTNKTRLDDYERAIHDETALLMKVHKSNYAIVGFSEEVSISELATLAHSRNILAADDLGCGAMVPLERYGLAHEMTLAESVAAGADLTLSSTDKLIGGPQGGLIIGRGELIRSMREFPLYRAFRVDKMTLAALEATLKLFLDPESLSITHPLYRALSLSPGSLRERAERLAARLSPLVPSCPTAVVPHEAFLGGGSLPTQALPSYAVALRPPSPSAFARKLRTGPIPVVPHLHRQVVLLDLRSILPEEEDRVLQALQMVGD